MRPRLLLADDDPAVSGFLSEDLRGEGFEVEVVDDAERLLAVLGTGAHPDLLLLDVARTGGVEVLRRLRAQPGADAMPVIVVTARASAADKALGLASGADDWVDKPFDTLELVARVRATLRRTSDVRESSPLTGLPGNHRIDLEVARRAAGGLPYAVCHVDLDEFKSYNDAYGFLRGDEVLLLTAASLQCAVHELEGLTPFLGHVGGDDFVVVCTPAQAEPLAGSAIAQFDAAVPALYDPADRERGWLEAVDRRGEKRRYALVAMSIGIASHTDGDRDHRAVVAAANEMKGVAKGQPGSSVAVDRRR